MGAGQPVCKPGPAPANCTGWGPFVLHDDWTNGCLSHCDEVEKFLSVPGPGSFPDADMLIVGNTACSAVSVRNGLHCGSLTHAEEQSQMAIWAVGAAPLFMSNDLRNVSKASKAILLNRHLLAINQDVLGRIGHRIYKDASGGQKWAKELAGGAVAVALYNAGYSEAHIMASLPFFKMAPNLQVLGAKHISNPE